MPAVIDIKWKEATFPIIWKLDAPGTKCYGEVMVLIKKNWYRDIRLLSLWISGDDIHLCPNINSTKGIRYIQVREPKTKCCFVFNSMRKETFVSSHMHSVSLVFDNIVYYHVTPEVFGCPYE